MKLQAYAREKGGRYLLFGSAARGEMRYDSDMDFILDFAPEEVPAARSLAEDLCAAEGLRCDHFQFSSLSTAFLERILLHARELS